MSRWGVASAGCKAEVKELPLKGTGEARCRPQETRLGSEVAGWVQTKRRQPTGKSPVFRKNSILLRCTASSAGQPPCILHELLAKQHWTARLTTAKMKLLMKLLRTTGCLPPESTECLVEYNFRRPHRSLGYRSPNNFIYKHQRLLPMYPDEGTHWLLQTQAKVLNQELATTVARWSQTLKPSAIAKPRSPRCRCRIRSCRRVLNRPWALAYLGLENIIHQCQQPW
jgi:hypothetical protein